LGKKYENSPRLGFSEKKFELPALNKDQKVVRVYTVGYGKPVFAKQNKSKETILTNLQCVDKDVIIIVFINSSIKGYDVREQM
jgi:hypothetical protein